MNAHPNSYASIVIRYALTLIESKDVPYRFCECARVIIICDEVVVYHMHYENDVEGIEQTINHCL